MDKEEEIKNLIISIKEVFGYDFTNYSNASIVRRVTRFSNKNNLTTLKELKNYIFNSPEIMEDFIEEITVNVTEMFRDPSFYLALRIKIMPFLATYPFIRIWIAGCSTGEEVLSLAMVLKEEGILNRCKIYATDINKKVLEAAKAGICPFHNLKDYTANYIKIGGKANFSDYYFIKGNYLHFDKSLLDNVVFTNHNLVSDNSFNEFNLIFCRNVLIYFNRNLQNRVIELFYESLSVFGFLALGSKESICFSGKEENFEIIDKEEKLFRKVK